MAADIFSTLQTLSERSDLRGKTVLVRSSVDVPLASDGKVVDDFRLRKSLPTLQMLRAAGARVIIAGHASRADGTSDASLRPVCDLLNTYIPVAWAGGIVGPEISKKAAALNDGEVLMLENLRRDPGEKANDPAFAKHLASLAELYVNDAFSVSHREHASIVGVPRLIPSCAGQLFMSELEHLSLARTPKPPSLFVLGGAKFETKLPLVEQLHARYDRIFIGGALANSFFKARGFEVGDSLVSPLDITPSPLFTSAKLILPIDVTVMGKEGPVAKAPHEVLKDETILDAGPQTLEMLAEEMRFVETVLWNGPLGDYERGFDTGTRRFADIVAHSRAVSIVGGGDTVASVKETRVTDRFSFLSTAGGAMLAFLEKGMLPGIAALMEGKR